MSAERPGQVVTFYSYKGGTGRTMAMANLAWILAANGRRVLIVDWDLESPGLHRYFAPSLLDPRAVAATRGVMNMVRRYQDVAAETRDQARGPAWYRSLARVSDTRWRSAGPSPATGRCTTCPPACRSAATRALSQPWTGSVSTNTSAAAELFDAFRTDMKENYDYAFIDSRTGLSDVADICTLHLPDVVVNCFTLNNQGIEGALTVGSTVARFASRPIRLLAVPMRVDEAEKNRADDGRATVRRRFAELKLDELASPNTGAGWRSRTCPSTTTRRRSRPSPTARTTGTRCSTRTCG